jgi:hypothetical protein
MQCRECTSAYIRKNGKKEANKITSASIVVASLLTVTIHLKATPTNSNENVSKCTSMIQLMLGAVSCSGIINGLKVFL